MGPLASDRQPLAMPKTPIASDIHQTFDAHVDVAPEISFHLEFLVDDGANSADFVLGQILHMDILGYLCFGEDTPGNGFADAVNVGQGYDGPFIFRDVYTRNSRHGDSFSTIAQTDSIPPQAVIPAVACASGFHR
jgi:hypothetical protein